MLTVEGLGAELVAAGGAVRVGVAARCEGIGRDPKRLPPPVFELFGADVLGDRLGVDELREDPNEPLLDDDDRGALLLLPLLDRDGLL